MLWMELKQAVLKPTSITELKRFCAEEWAKIPTKCCAGLISSHKKCLDAVIPIKGDRTRYWNQKFTCFCCLICLIEFSLSTFRTCVKIWWCHNYEVIIMQKHRKLFLAALYIFISFILMFWNKYCIVFFPFTIQIVLFFNKDTLNWS